MSEVRTTERDEKFKKNLITRLNKIEGQVKGIKKMVENDIYCDDVLTQIAAVKSALNSVSKVLLESHLKHCVVEKIKNSDEEVIDEFLKTLGRIL